MKHQHKYNYFYKITNNINGHFYYGVHCTDNLNDKYMGSGKRLHCAYKIYGKENFTKEIIKYFDSSAEAFLYESEFLTEDLIKNPNCYNIQYGGEGWNTAGLATVRDKDGNTFDVPVDDERILSGELVGVTKGYGIYCDDNGNWYKLLRTDPLVISGKVYGFSKNKSVYKDNDGNSYLLYTDDKRVISGELTHFGKGKFTAKDEDGNFHYINVNDKRFISGELHGTFYGRKHSEETKEKLISTFAKIKHQQGSKNSQFGKCWVYKIENNKLENKSINKDELDKYLSNGWIKGRKMKL